MSRDIELSRPHLSPASAGGATLELRSADRIITPEELQAQGDATIARVKEFFDGIDITTPLDDKNRQIQRGVINISLSDFEIGRSKYRSAVARVNGFEAAEMWVYNTSRDGVKAMYQLQGGVGDSGCITCRTFVFVYESGGISITTIFDEYRSSRKIARHETGITPERYVTEREAELERKYDESHHLTRPQEIAVLQEIGVPITFTEPVHYSRSVVDFLR